MYLSFCNKPNEISTLEIPIINYDTISREITASRNLHIIVRAPWDGRKMFNLNASPLIHQAFMAYPIQKEGNILQRSGVAYTGDDE